MPPMTQEALPVMQVSAEWSAGEGVGCPGHAGSESLDLRSVPPEGSALRGYPASSISSPIAPERPASTSAHHMRRLRLAQR
jgi:hypothetical protein